VVGEIPQQTLVCAIVWFVFQHDVAWYSFSSGSPLYFYGLLSKPGSTWTRVIAHVVVGLSYVTISRGRVAKATLWDRHATVKALDYVREVLDLQVPARTAYRWRP
jgi:hypothetical protein